MSVTVLKTVVSGSRWSSLKLMADRLRRVRKVNSALLRLLLTSARCNSTLTLFASSQGLLSLVLFTQCLLADAFSWVFGQAQDQYR